MITFTKAQCLSVLRQTPRKVLLPLLLAVLSLAALFIPAAEYIQWDNYVGLSFCVLIAFFIVKSILPESLTAMFANRWWRIALAIAAITITAVFFCTDHPRGFFEKPNVIEIYPKEPGFAIHQLEGERVIIPCTGYIAKGGSEGWELKRYQSYIATKACTRPFTLILSTEFIQKNRLALRVNARSEGYIRLRINDNEEKIVTERAVSTNLAFNCGETTIPLFSFSLLPPTDKHHILIDVLQIVGQICIALLAIFATIRLLIARKDGKALSWRIMALLAILVYYLAITNFPCWVNSDDLSRLEPNLLPPPKWSGYKHPVFIQGWWQIAMTIIPVRSCWLAFPIALSFMYLVGLLAIVKLLCASKCYWLAWFIFGAMLQLACLLLWEDAYLLFEVDNDTRFILNKGAHPIPHHRYWILVDYLMLVSAMFAVGCIALLMIGFDKLKQKIPLIVVCLFSIYTVLVVRHEAFGVALALCLGLAGICLKKIQSTRWQQFYNVFLCGLLTCLLLCGFHKFLERKYILPIPAKVATDRQIVEIRRLLISDILRIAYCHNSNYDDGVDDDVRACLDSGLIGYYMTRCWEDKKFKPISTKRLIGIWLRSILTYPYDYLDSKTISTFL